MSQAIVIAGTGTDVGKTVFAAALVAALDGYYWKPIQAGLMGETDAQIVRRLCGLSADRILPEVYRLATAASPHFAAERAGVTIDKSKLAIPATPGPLVIEGAGGLLVPLTRQLLQIDLFAEWKAPVILVASTRLGTINHSLLSVEALKRRAITILGIAFIGAANPDNERTICEMGGVKTLGRLPTIEALDAASLQQAFSENFKIADVLGLGAYGP